MVQISPLLCRVRSPVKGPPASKPGPTVERRHAKDGHPTKVEDARVGASLMPGTVFKLRS